MIPNHSNYYTSSITLLQMKTMLIMFKTCLMHCLHILQLTPKHQTRTCYDGKDLHIRGGITQQSGAWPSLHHWWHHRRKAEDLKSWQVWVMVTHWWLQRVPLSWRNHQRVIMTHWWSKSVVVVVLSVIIVVTWGDGVCYEFLFLRRTTSIFVSNYF